MICPDCRGRGFTPRMAAIDDEPDDLGPMMGPCETCGGSGWASSSDAAGSAEQRFVCAGCGAVQNHRMILCEECGEPLVFLDRAPPFRQHFTCPRCFAMSYNPNDIRERYCGRCHQFADDYDAA